jgi:hypothetical protein
MRVTDAYLMELQIEDLMYDLMDAQELQDCDLPERQPETGQVPARFADRFATFEEYQEAMADFLNGM